MGLSLVHPSSTALEAEMHCKDLLDVFFSLSVVVYLMEYVKLSMNLGHSLFEAIFI